MAIITVFGNYHTVHAQGTDLQANLQTTITDTITRTAREQTEKVIKDTTQKSLDTISTTAQNADDKLSGGAISTIQEKAPLLHDKLYLPLDGWRMKQISVWEQMIQQQETSTEKVPTVIQDVADKINTVRNNVPTVGEIDQTKDSEKVFSSTAAINQAVSDTSIDPGKTLGNTYTLFLKLLLIILKSRVLFYGLSILFLLGIISKILRFSRGE